MTSLRTNHVGLIDGRPILVRTYDDDTVTAELLSPEGRGTGESTLVAEKVGA